MSHLQQAIRKVVPYVVPGGPQEGHMAFFFFFFATWLLTEKGKQFYFAYLKQNWT